MFQYAFGRALSLKNKTELLIDISSFEKDSLRNYNLFPFNIVENFVGKDDLNRVIKQNEESYYSFLKKISIKITSGTPIVHYKEKYFHYDPLVIKLPNNIYLDGYWQSASYFEKYDQIIRTDFKFKSEPDSHNESIGLKILKENSICVHIRRGDYVTNPDAYIIHGICEKDYYIKAIKFIINRTIHPHLFIFSDDPEWAKRNIDINAPLYFISHNNATKNYEDLRLMSLCKHHIIANSTFSWWGAWLGKKENQIVIAPDPWFDDPKLNAKDIYCENWIKIKK